MIPEAIMYVSILIKGDTEKRIDIPVNVNKVDDTFCQRVQAMSTEDVKIWVWGGMAATGEYMKRGLEQEAKILGRPSPPTTLN